MKRKKEKQGLQTIGIMGTERGVGVTHLAIMLGNYIHARWRADTAILEMNQSDALRELQRSYSVRDSPMTGEGSFHLSDVTYYSRLKERPLGSVYSAGHEWLIIDFGACHAEAAEEFVKCDKKLIVGNVTPWNSQKMVDCIEKLIAMDCKKQICYIARFGTESDISQIKDRYDISIYNAPFEPDPFLIHGYNFGFLEGLLR
ncbi:hypothetical protein [Konateibacter massiliensis]|uniref:hypothetical protein n=1 Tax=Konateibacter massiliensis TaxID=2002841 RepID=UPI000C14BF4C|nr:hypothetical protein [Konateibacter massiliensis]